VNLALVEPIVNAVLYEGYMLYPYRPSSVKNRQRWTFGGVYPRTYSEGHGGIDPWAAQAECLVVGDPHAPVPRIELRIRFLHLLARQAGELAQPVPELADDVEPDYRPVEALRVGERLYQSWQEAAEREVALDEQPLDELVAHSRRVMFVFPASRALEPLRDGDGPIVGVLAREQRRIEGAIELSAISLTKGVWKVTARVSNLTPLEDAAHASRDDGLLRSFASTHTILGVAGGEFVSLLDPPDELREAAAACSNVGVWPVLVGAEGERTMVLASPIILYDYPQIAPESPGNLFDGTEIDEILTLRIMTMTDEEKREMGATDARARALLDRTESLDQEQLMALHGTLRGLRPLEETP
jgi:hypothetical protein